MNRKTQYLAQTILGLLPGNFLISRLEGRLPGAQRLGRNLKCHCPYHTAEDSPPESAFRSFIVDFGRQTARCTLTNCDAHRQHDLLQLIAFLERQHPLTVMLQILTEGVIEPNERLREQVHQAARAEIADLARDQETENLRDILPLFQALFPDDREILLDRAVLDSPAAPQRNGEQFHAIARECIAGGSLALAADAIAMAEESAPDDPQLLKLKGQLGEARGEHKAAAAFYWDYLERGAEGGEPPDLAELLRKIVEFDPTHARAIERLAQWDEARGDAAAASRNWERLIQLHVARGDRENALQVSRRLLELCPGDPHVIKGHANLLAEAGRRDEAAQHYEQLAAGHSEAAQAGDASQWPAAEKLLRAALALQPGCVDLSRRLLDALLGQDQLDRAFRQGEILLAQLEREGQTDQRIDLLKQLLDLQPARTALREKLLRLLEQAGDGDAVLKELLHLADGYFQNEQTAEGLGRLARAAAIAKGNAAALEAVADAYARRDDAKRAAQLYEQAGRLTLKTDPDKALELSQRALALLNDDPESAAGDALRVLQYEVFQARGDQEKILEVLPHLVASGSRELARVGADQLRALVRNYPETTAFRLMLIDALIDERKIHQALSEIRQATAHAPPDAVAADLKRLREYLKRLQDSLPPEAAQERLDTLAATADIIERLAESDPAHKDELAEILLSALELQRERDNPHEVRQLHHRLQNLRPGDAQIAASHADYVLAQSGPAEARPLFEALLTLQQTAGDAPMAIATLRRMLEWDESDVLPRRRLADCLAENDRWDEARAEYDRLIAALREADPNHPAIAECLDAVLAHEPDNTDVLRELAEYAERQEDSAHAVEHYLRLADAHRQNDDLDGALSCLEDALKNRPRDPEILERLAAVHEARGDADHTRVTLESLLDCWRERDEPERVLATLERLAAAAPERADWVLQLGDLLISQNQSDRALELLCDAAETHREAERFEQALQLLHRQRERFPERTEVRSQIVETALAAGQTEPALAVLRETLERAKSPKELQQARDGLLQLRQATRRVAALGDESDSAAPIETLEMLGVVYERLGQRPELAETLRALLELRRAAKRLEESPPAAVAELFDRLLELHPSDAQLLRDRAEHALQHENPAAARPFLERLLAAHEAAQETPQAAGVYQQLLECEPDDRNLRRRYADFLAAHKRWEEARPEYDRLIEIAAKGNDDSAVGECLEIILIHEPKNALVLDRLAELNAAHDNAELARQRLLEAAEIHESENRLDEALASLSRALDLQADDLEILERLARIHEARDEPEPAAKIQERLMTALLEAGEADRALEALERLFELAPERGDLHLPHLQTCDSWIAAGEPEQADKHLERLIQRYRQAARHDTALELLRRQLERLPDRREIRAAIVDVLIEAGQPERASEECSQLADWLLERNEEEPAAIALERLRELAPDDVGAVYRLARVHENLGRLGKAVAGYENAARAYREAADAQALDVMRHLLELQPHRLELKAELAQWLHEDGLDAEAASHLLHCCEKAFVSGQSVTAAAQVVQLLEWLPADDEQRARLATVLDEHHQGKGAERILLELSVAAREAGAGELALAACVQGLAAEPARKRLQRALAETHQALEQTAQACDAYRQLARLHAADGEADAAVAVLESAQALDPENSDVLEALLKLFLERQDAEHAQKTLRRLIELAEGRGENTAAIDYRSRLAELQPADYENRRQLAQTLHADGQVKAAETELKQLLEDALAEKHYGAAKQTVATLREWKPDDEALMHREIQCWRRAGDEDEADELLRQLARRHEENGQSDKAIDIWRALFDRDPASENAYEKLKELLRSRGKTKLYFEVLGQRLARHEERAEWEAALAIREELLERKPDDVAELEATAEIELKLERRPRALERLLKALDLSARRDAAERSIALARRILEIDERHTPARERLAAIHEKANDPEQALNALAPIAAELYADGAFDKAVEYQRRLIRRFPELLEPRETLSQWLQDSDRPGEALDELLGIYKLLIDRGDAAKAAFGLEDRLVKCCGGAPELLARIPRWLAEHQQLGRSERILIQLIEDAEERGDVPAIVECCAMAREAAPDSIPIHERAHQLLREHNETETALHSGIALGRLLAAAGRAAKAEKVLRGLLELDPAHAEAHEALIDFLAGQQRPEELVAQLNVLAELHESAERLEDALAVDERLLELAPDDEAVLIRKARRLCQLERLQEGLKILTNLSRRHEEAEQWEPAVHILELACELAPEDTGLLRRLVQVARSLPDPRPAVQYKQQLADRYEKVGNIDKAIELLEELIIDEPEECDRYEKLADLAMHCGDSSRATDALGRLCEQYEASEQFENAVAIRQRLNVQAPGDVDNLRALGVCYEQLGETAKALEAFQTAVGLLKEKEVWSEAVALVKIMLALDESQIELRYELVRLWEALDDGLAANRERTSLADALIAVGDNESNLRAIDVLKRIVTEDPDYASARERLALLLVQHNDPRAAVVELGALVELYESRKMFPEAVSCCLQILAVEPNDLGSHKKLFKFYRNTNETEMLLSEALWLGDAAIAAGDFIHAEEYLLQAREADPDHVELREKLVLLYQRQERGADALELLRPLIEHARTNDDKRLATYLEQAVAHQPADLDLLRQLIDEFQRTDQHERAAAQIRETAAALLEADKLDEMRKLLALSGERFPGNQELRLELVQLCVDCQQFDLAAAAHLERVVELAGEERWAETIEACDRVLELDPRLLPACEHLVRALTAQDNRERLGDVLPMLVELHQDAGNLDAAIEAAERLVELDPARIPAHEKLLELRAATGDVEGEIAAIELLATLCADAGDVENALRHLARALELEPKNTALRERHLELAAEIETEEQLAGHLRPLIDQFREAGNAEKVEEFFALAKKIAPNDVALRERLIQHLQEAGRDAEALDETLALARLLFEQKHPKKAADRLSAAAETAAEDPRIQQLLGEVYLSINYKGRALEAWRNAATLLAGSDAPADETQQVYRTILEIDPQDADAQTRLIESLFDTDQLSEALERSLELANQYLERKLPDLAEAIYQRILEHQPQNVAVRRQLIDVHEKLGHHEDMADQCSRLATIYQEKGLIDEALNTLRQLIEVDPNNTKIRRQSIDLRLAFTNEEEMIDEYFELAGLLIERDRREEAADIYRRILSFDADHQAASKALQACSKGESPEAIAKITSDTASVARASAAPPQAAADLEKAIKTYQMITKREAENAEAHKSLADCYEQAGRLQDAQLEWSLASRLYFEQVYFSECMRVCEKILSYQPSDGAVRERLRKAQIQAELHHALESSISSITDFNKTQQ